MKFGNTISGLIAATLFSCGTEEISPDRLFVKEIKDPTCYKDLFEYEDGQLIEFKRLFGERQETTIHFHYLGTQLMKIETKRDQGLQLIIELSYGENGLRQEEKVTAIYNGEITSIKNGAFTYRDGVLKSIKYTFSDPNYFQIENEFHWSNGNIAKIDFYFFHNNERHSNGNRIFTYDNKINYSNQDLAFIYTVGAGDETKISKNNLITTVDDTGNVTLQGGQYLFTYNTTGYPVKYTYKSADQEFSPVQIIYH